jgi:hypothetical protein
MGGSGRGIRAAIARSPPGEAGGLAGALVEAGGAGEAGEQPDAATVTPTATAAASLDRLRART